MRTRLKMLLTALLIVAIVVPSTLVWASETQRFIFQKQLHVEEPTIDGDTQYANITDDGSRVAGLYIRVERPPPNSMYAPIYISIPHSEDTELDSMTLTFSMNPNYLPIYMEAPQPAWPETLFSHTDGNLGVVYSVKDLGFYGTGTVTLHFIMIRTFQYTNPESSLTLELEFSAHKKTLIQLTSLTAHTILYFPISE